MTNDRTATKQTYLDLSDTGLGDDLRSFLKDPVQPAPRSRNLLPTFRVVPGDQASGGPGADRGFPGTRTFLPSAIPSHRTDRGQAGGALQPAPAGPDAAPASAARTDNHARRRVAVQQAGRSAPALGPAEPADQSAAGGDIRRRRPSGRSGTAVGSADRSADRTGKKAKPAKAGSVIADLPKAIAKLIPQDAASPSVSPSKLIPTEAERSDARRLFREIGERFNENRKKSKTAAYAAYRHDLMANLDVLIMGGAIDLKEVTTVITNLELLTKETEAESTETPATVLGKWLRMDAAEVAGLSSEADQTMDANELAEVDDEGVLAEDDPENELAGV